MQSINAQANNELRIDNRISEFFPAPFSEGQLKRYNLDEKFQKAIGQTTLKKVVLIFCGTRLVYHGEIWPMTEAVEWSLVKREMMNDEKKRDEGAGVGGQGK